MNKFDLIFGQNWIDQFQFNTAWHSMPSFYFGTATRAIESATDVGKIIGHAFGWADTPQGDSIWFHRRWRDYSGREIINELIS